MPQLRCGTRTPSYSTNALARAAVTYAASSAVSGRSLDSAMVGCYCGGGRPSRIVSPRALHTPVSTGTPWLLRALACSFALHLAVVGLVAGFGSADAPHATETIDIEVAPPPPVAEVLPTGHERERAPEPQAVPAATA